MLKQEIIDYIISELEKGSSEESIAKQLKDAGWSEEVVRDSFEQIQTTPSGETQAINPGSKLSPVREFSAFIYIAVAFVLLDYLVFDAADLLIPFIFFIVGYITYSRRKRAVSGAVPVNKLSDKTRKNVTIALFIFILLLFGYIFSV